MKNRALIAVIVVWSPSHIQFLETPWTIACQAPLSMAFPRQKYWSGLPFCFPWYSFICKGNAQYATGLLFHSCYYWHCQFFCQRSIGSYRRFNIFSVKKVQQEASTHLRYNFSLRVKSHQFFQGCTQALFWSQWLCWCCYFLETSLIHARWEIFTGSWKEDIWNNASILNDIACIVSSE